MEGRQIGLAVRFVEKRHKVKHQNVNKDNIPNALEQSLNKTGTELSLFVASTMKSLDFDGTTANSIFLVHF